MNKPPVGVEFADTFLSSLKQLKKRYRQIQKDLAPLIKKLQNGETPGNQIPGTGFTVYKVRLPNRDARRGKSGGYRVIYYVKTPTRIVMIEVYSKSDTDDIATSEIANIIGEIES